MDIYRQRSSWKMVLAVFGALVLLITVVYSNYLAEQLRRNEEKNKVIYAMALKDLFENVSDGDLQKDITFQDTVRSSFPLPTILEYVNGDLIGQNWGENKNMDEDFLRSKKEEFLSEGREPIESEGESRYIYFFNSPLLDYIKFYPLVQLLLVASFILLAYYIFNTSRRAEQNRVWAGMAKETAHQLGTPISAIIAWIEHLKMMHEGDPEHMEIVDELRKDVNRLELVADRFSKIGSAPDLVAINIYTELDKCITYMQRRAPRNVFFHFANEGNILVDINEHLFDWVIENLMRNALDAMDGKGSITVAVYDAGHQVGIDITDTGKGIPASKFATVFKPGYSTKKRGWGLGLSLAKRIIEEYHSGKIFVKTSKPDEGTTFSIRLPKAK